MIDKEQNLIELAWGIIANVSGGDWDKQTKEWKAAAIRWRDRWVAHSQKKKLMADRYLRVKFGDNDFGIPVQAALKRIWADVHENNADNIDPSTSHTIPEMFRELHKAGALESMVARAIDCENHYSEVECSTRCLYWEKICWEEKTVAKTFESITDVYLSIDLSFHEKMSEEWTNGEEAWLDLETGKVKSR